MLSFHFSRASEWILCRVTPEPHRWYWANWDSLVSVEVVTWNKQKGPLFNLLLLHFSAIAPQWACTGHEHKSLNIRSCGLDINVPPLYDRLREGYSFSINSECLTLLRLRQILPSPPFLFFIFLTRNCLRLVLKKKTKQQTLKFMSEWQKMNWS